MRTNQRLTGRALLLPILSATAVTALLFPSLFSGPAPDPEPKYGVPVITTPQERQQIKELSEPYQPEGTRRMAQLLEELGKDSDRKLLEQRPDPNLARYVRNIKQPFDLRSRTVLEAK